MRRILVLAALVAIGALSASVAAFQGQQPQATLPDLTKVKENLYIIEASSPADRSKFTGGNTGVFITDRGVVVVDTKLAGYGPRILEKIKAVTPKPVIMIINTHTHGDHTGSNDGFPPTVDIVAQENTKANMAKMDAFKGEKAQFLPKRTYKDKLSLLTGKDRVDLYYFGPGHTNGDTFVVYPALRVLQTGDMFAWRDAPVLDRNNGGSGVEFPRTLAKLLAGIKDVDTVIPGHSPVTTLKDLEEYQRFNADLLTEVQNAKRAGKSVDDAVASINLTTKYPGYKSERMKAAVQAIYDELAGTSSSGQTAPAPAQGSGSAAAQAPAPAQPDFSKVEIKTTKIAGNFYTLEGQGGTIGVLAGPDGVFMVDSQFAPLTDKIVAAIRQISDKPIRFLVNTHVHGDHTGGNENLAKLGVTILARDELRMRLAKTVPAAAVPLITYDGPVTVHMNGEDVRLVPVRVAHTDGDTLVHFPGANVIMTGDFYRSVGYPNIDRANGGTLKGLVDALNHVIALAKPDTRIIPGHGAIVDKTAVAAHRDMILAIRDRVAALMKEGKSQEQVIAAKPTSEYDARVPNATQTADRFVGQLYAELRPSS
jgi:glyoxylase-like metal-dependent hydrolase (beta-lactamase superfamily II)